MTNQATSPQPMTRITNVHSRGVTVERGEGPEWNLRSYGLGDALRGYVPRKPDITLLVPLGQRKLGEEIAEMLAMHYEEDGHVIEAWEMQHDLPFIAVDHNDADSEVDYVLSLILADPKKFQADLDDAACDAAADDDGGAADDAYDRQRDEEMERAR